MIERKELNPNSMAALPIKEYYEGNPDLHTEEEFQAYIEELKLIYTTESINKVIEYYRENE